MSLGREEALRIFRAWHDSRALIRCEFSFRALAACFRGRIMDVSDGVMLLSDDTFTELNLPFTEALTFRQVEAHELPEFCSSAISIQFPSITPEADFVLFAAMEEG